MSVAIVDNDHATISVAQADLPVTIRGYQYDVASPDDIGEVLNIYNAQYGDGYPYFPTREDMETHHFHKAIELESGTIRGINRASVVDVEAGDYEFGGAVVDPNFRGRGIAKILTQIRWGGMSDLFVRRVYSEPVNNDRNNASLNNIRKNGGFSITGVFPGKHPSLANVAEGQALTTSDMWWLNPHAEGSRTLSLNRMYLPNDYRQALQQLIPEQLWTGDERIVPDDYSDLDPVENPPKDEGGSASVSMPANHPDTREAIADYRRRGYLLRGILLANRRIHGDQYVDEIGLYKPPETGLDFDKITAPEWLQGYMQFMRSEYAMSVSGDSIHS